jgi:hypothetical protein
MRTKTSIVLGLMVIAASFACYAIAAESDAKKAAQPEMKLPPGWTMEDMQACMIAGTPGEMQKFLAKDAGTWKAKNKMWMAPGAEAMDCESTVTIAPIMDGRYMKTEMKGEMPAGMGPFNSVGINGFDNVSQQFVGTWIDNQSTGIMNGTGKLSDDKKTMTWNFTFNCPLTKKPTALRQIETDTGPKSKTIEIYSTDPKSGKEYKMMVSEMTKQ